jgi:hypothetical protein
MSQIRELERAKEFIKTVVVPEGDANQVVLINCAYQLIGQTGHVTKRELFGVQDYLLRSAELPEIIISPRIGRISGIQAANGIVEYRAVHERKFRQQYNHFRRNLQ